MTRRRGRPSLPAPGAEPGAALEVVPSDPGPPERYQHGDIIRSEPADQAGVSYRRVTTQSALDRYLVRDQISQRQFDAGAKLFRLWRASGGVRRVIANYGPRVRAERELSDEQAVLRQRVSEVLRHMGPLAGVLVHVCLCDEAARDWARARGDVPQAGIVVLRLALDALADYWRL